MSNHIKELREAANMTQDELARAINKSTRAIQTWERGEKFPNAEAIWDMCQVFKCDPNTLLGWYDTHEKPRGEQLGWSEMVLLGNYRRCGRAEQESAMMTVRALAASSKASAEGSAAYKEAAQG